jgi:hypothetical protein
LTPNPILKVLSTLSRSGVRYLLMGGQACVLYGGAEFSRDTDVVLLAEPENLGRLRQALEELEAECIAVPPFEADYLQRGHAVHFRCRQPDAAGMRLDVMAVMRGVAPFADLWQRRTTLEDPSGVRIEAIALPDLVQAKKTQRDKDWPMIRRLIEASYAQRGDRPTPEQIEFWLLQARTPSILIALARQYADQAARLAVQRPLLSSAVAGNESDVTVALEAEEKREREVDRAYWAPLKAELEELRRRRRH